MGNKNGLFIVIEGIDGTGKSSQAKLLANYLEENGHQVLIEREPTDGPYGRQLRKSMTEGRLSPQEELDLFHADRKHHVEEIIKPALAKGTHIILDRYYFSTMAYQGQRGFDIDELRATNEAFAPAPDILLVLDLDVDQALDRIGARGDTANEFEQRDSLQFCRDTFLNLKNEPYTKIIDTTPSIQEVHQEITKIIRPHLKNPEQPKSKN